ncbi:hypothetical protein NEUTE1DRAFT_36522, partial [Neurospora tetrasperma FGSC 2508]
GISRAFERRNFAGKNRNFNIRCHQLNRPIFLGGGSPQYRSYIYYYFYYSRYNLRYYHYR